TVLAAMLSRFQALVVASVPSKKLSRTSTCAPPSPSLPAPPPREMWTASASCRSSTGKTSRTGAPSPSSSTTAQCATSSIRTCPLSAAETPPPTKPSVHAPRFTSSTSTGEKEYHDLATDPEELRNTFTSLSSEEKAALHKTLVATVNCHNAKSC